MNKDYTEALTDASVKNKKLHIIDFKEWVTVQHLDGSLFLFYKAFMVIHNKRFLQVYSEHNQPMVFFIEDLNIAGYGVGFQCLNNMILPGHTVYMAYNGSKFKVPNTNKIIINHTEDTKSILHMDIRYIHRVLTLDEAKDMIKQYRKFSKNKKQKIMENYMKSFLKGHC